MKVLVSIILFLIKYSAFALDYPSSPDLRLTPGSLCNRPDEYRYPENVPYCQRDVSDTTKRYIYNSYRRHLKYGLNPGKKSDYKIDHFIPLCAGGSNHEDNLWPQHVSIYLVTDPIDEVGCVKLSEGRIKQKELVKIIKRVKANPSEAGYFLKQLKRL